MRPLLSRLTVGLLPFLIAAAALAIWRAQLKEAQTHAKHDASTYQKTRTLALIKSVCVALQMYVNEEGSLPNLRSYGNESARNSELVRILTDCTNRTDARALPETSLLPVSYSTNNPGLLDGWDHPIHVLLAVSNTGWVMVGQHRIPKSFAVWSDGQDGINELGDGDDLRSW